MYMKTPTEPVKIKNRLIFLSDAPSLQEIGAFNVALELWRYYMSCRYKLTTTTCIYYFYSYYTKEILSALPKRLPSVCRQIIEEHVNLIMRELQYWMMCAEHYYYTKEVKTRYHYHKRPVLFPKFDDFVWCGNFTIDYVKTARNMLKCTKFDNWQKFLISCGYCFKEEIDQLWQSVSQYALSLNIYPNKLYVFDWISRKSGKWLSNTEDMTKKCYLWISINNKSAIEYYWRRLNSVEQVFAVRNIIRSCSKCEQGSIENVLSKLSELQWIQLLQIDEGKTLLSIKIYKNGCSMFRVWAHIRNMIDIDQFINVMICDLYDDNNHTAKEIYLLKEEIWSSAPEQLKRAAMKFDKFSNSIGSRKDPKVFVYAFPRELHSHDFDPEIEFLRNNWTRVFRQLDKKFKKKHEVHPCFERNLMITLKIITRMEFFKNIRDEETLDEDGSVLESSSERRKVAEFIIAHQKYLD